MSNKEEVIVDAEELREYIKKKNIKSFLDCIPKEYHQFILQDYKKWTSSKVNTMK